MGDFGREKNPDWLELDDKDKIERLSHTIQRQDVLLGRVASYLGLLVDHDHLNGKIVQSIGKTKYIINDEFPHYVLPKRWLY